jgi:DNA (cytosine-5)-methyltransferase 1
MDAELLWNQLMSVVGETPELPAEILDISDQERNQHRELVLRHTDFIIKLLAADQELRAWTPAAGCPHSTPEIVARKRKKAGTFPCLYSTVERYQGSADSSQKQESDSGCHCTDPLVDSDDPLDSVAAVSLATSNRSLAERYTDWQWRATVAELRDRYSTWDEIAELSEAELEGAIEAAKGSAVDAERTRRLYRLLRSIEDDERFSGVTLQDLAPRAYSSFHSLLNSLPGVEEQDAWWLLLTAFDKPVWPSDPHIDRLLCDLGLLTPNEIEAGGRHEELENSLVDRQIPALHRALAGHAARGQSHFASEACEVRKFSLTYRTRKQQELSDNTTRPVAVDLFSGAGGISHGLFEAGFEIALAVDNDRRATDSYRLNHPQLPHDRIRCTDIEDLLQRSDWPELVPESPDIIVGGPPCQSLSVAGYRSRRADDSSYSIRDDPRTELYSRYLDTVSDLQPKALVLENVEGMASEIEDTEDRVVDQIIEDLEADGGEDDPAYVADFRTIDCSKYQIPQARKRIIIFGVRKDIAQHGITPETFFQTLEGRPNGDTFSLRQGLSGLPRLCWDEGGDVVLGKSRGPHSDYVAKHDLASGTDLSFNHEAREHPMEKDRKLFDIMDPGDTGWYVKYKKDGGKWSHLIEYNVGTEEDPAFTDKYRMIHWDEPAPTVVAHLAKDANNYILPDYYEYANPVEERTDRSRNRGVTPREAARLQSFPDDYIFLGPFTSQFRQIGNAVPPILAWHLGEVLQETVLDIPRTAKLEGSTRSSKVASSDD